MIPTTSTRNKVLVTGGGTYLGDYIAAALLAEGADVTLLVRPEAEDRLGPLRDRVRWSTADIWDPASLRGRARGHACVVNTVGSLTADPARGLNHHRLNFVSARNVVNMVISDGVPHTILLSTARAPWISRAYVHAKREAEEYVARVGVAATVIRAPLTYMRGARRPFFFALTSAVGTVPPFAWTPLGRVAPMPVDVLARAVARLALAGAAPGHSGARTHRLHAADLRRLNSREELRSGRISLPQVGSENDEDDTQPRRRPIELVDDDTPFGWSPD